jgi:hypothetical protein
MERCDGCEYEYDGLCTAFGKECNEIVFCTVTTSRVKEEVSRIHTIGKEKIEVKKKNEEHNVETAEQNKQDKINPAHYKERTSIECIDTMRIAFGDMDVAIYCIVNAYKYLWRHKYKNRLEDLKKAEWYLERYTDLTNDKEWIKLPDEKAETIKELVKKGREEYIHGKRN